MDRSEARAFSNTVRVLAGVLANPVIGHAEANPEEPILVEIFGELAQMGITPALGKELDADALHLISMRLIQLEEQAALWLTDGSLANFRIITADPSGPSSNPHDPDFNRLEAVTEIEVQEKSKFLRWPSGELDEVTYREYVAHGAPYKAADGHQVHDTTTSGPEGMLQVDGQVKQFGAATALAKRLLEAYCSGAV